MTERKTTGASEILRAGRAMILGVALGALLAVLAARGRQAG